MSRLPPGVRQRGTRFQARWRDAEGQQRSATFDNPADAYRHLTEGDRPTLNGCGITVGEWAIRWQAVALGRPSTLARDDSYLRTHVLPAFAERDLADINTWDMQQWVHGLGARLAPASIHKVAGVLSKLLTAAVHAGLIDTNPARSVVLPRIDPVEARFLLPAEIDRLEAAVAEVSPHWAELVGFLADTGVRIGEAAALTVADVHLDDRSVRVHRNLVEVRGHLHVGAPKTRHGVRTIPMLTDHTAHQLAQRIDRLELGPGDPLLGPPGGGPMRPSLMRARVWRRAVVRAALPGRVTPHTMRHTAVALWIAAGVTDAYKLSRWAGHRDVGTIYRIYGHLLPEDTEHYRERLAAIRGQR